jgi:hypothetical protein
MINISELNGANQYPFWIWTEFILFDMLLRFLNALIYLNLVELLFS